MLQKMIIILVIAALRLAVDAGLGSGNTIIPRFELGLPGYQNGGMLIINEDFLAFPHCWNEISGVRGCQNLEASEYF